MSYRHGSTRFSFAFSRSWIDSLAVQFVILFGCCLISSKAQQIYDDASPEAKWETLDNCKLVTSESMDGDSFHILHNGREYLVRLYFVDAPEGDATLRDRIQDQAAYFGIKADDVPRAGLVASKFTREKLTGKTFTVKTRWQNAMGRSSLARFYAIIAVGNEDLAELLVANGLVRIHGIRANVPGGMRSTTFVSKLQNLEITAREKKLGVWDESQFPRVPITAELTSTNAPPVKIVEAGETATNSLVKLIDLNSATTQELVALPAIGDKIAERIIAARPFNSVDDLKKVPGIGQKTFEKLSPLVNVVPAKASKSSTN